MEEPKDWLAPTPTSVLDLRKTPQIKAQTEELGIEEIDSRLKHLVDLDACFNAARMTDLLPVGVLLVV